MSNFNAETTEPGNNTQTELVTLDQLPDRIAGFQHEQ